METLKTQIDALCAGGVPDRLVFCAGCGDRVLFRHIHDGLSGAENRLSEHTRFDLASVTKSLATATLTLLAFDRGTLSPDTPVSRFYACPEEKKALTVERLLTHTVGVGHLSLCVPGVGYDNVAQYILSVPCEVPVGSEVRYSCPGYILLGKILEKLYDRRLDDAFEKEVARPLGLMNTGFLPKGTDFVNANLSPEESGLVNDYNCRFLGGVAGNAGLFSDCADMERYVAFLLHGGRELLRPGTLYAATREHTPKGACEAFGWGFVYVDGRYKQTGTLFPRGSFGHCGHTGQSVFVDPASGRWALILSDATVSTVRACGAERYEEVKAFRKNLHDLAARALFPCV